MALPKGLETSSGPQQSEIREPSGPPALGCLAVGSPALNRFLQPQPPAPRRPSHPLSPRSRLSSGTKKPTLLLQEWCPPGGSSGGSSSRRPELASSHCSHWRLAACQPHLGPHVSLRVQGLGRREESTCLEEPRTVCVSCWLTYPASFFLPSASKPLPGKCVEWELTV